MREWFILITEYVVLAINAIALFMIVVGTAQAFVAGLPAILSPVTGFRRREVWLRYARWLVVGLTYQLAADIVETAITSDWEAIGRVAAIAAIRTFLNYFLEKDLREAHELQETPGPAPEAEVPPQARRA